MMSEGSFHDKTSVKIAPHTHSIPTDNITSMGFKL